jgi:ketosteroid isomerase-like protein
MWSRGDIEGTLDAMDPEVKWHRALFLPDVPVDTPVYRGHDEVRKPWENFRSAWEQVTIELKEVVYDADDLVIVRVRFRGRGERSGASVQRKLFYAMEIRDGKLTRSRPFQDAAEARSAVGR